MPVQLSVDSLPPGAVGRAGSWAVVNRDSEVAAMSARCRHQLGDLSKGALDGLVCPWHGSRDDVDSGQMVSGPKEFLCDVGEPRAVRS